MAVWEFNRGEWTEAYVFLRLLGEGRIYGASADLVKDEKTYIDIVEVIRDEPYAYARFERFLEDEIAKVKALDDEEVVFKIITAPELNEKASFLYHEIMTAPGGSRKLRVPIIQEYLEDLRFKTPKANLSEQARQKYGAKTDIIITTQNSLDKSISTEGFSIKDYDSLDHSKLQELFAGFIVNTEIPQTVSIDDQTEENKKAIQERFAGITVNTAIPQAVSVDDKTEENKKTIKERFAGINTAVEIPKTEKIDKLSIELTRFEDVKAFSEEIALPKKILIDKTINLKTPHIVSLPTIPKVDFSDILANADSVSLRGKENQ